MVSAKSTAEFMLTVAILLSNLSQIPALMGSSFMRTGYLFAWTAALLLLLLTSQFRINIRYLVLPAVFDVFCMIGELFGKEYMSSNLFIPVNMSAFIFLVGMLFGKITEQKAVDRLAIWYILSSLLVGAFVYIKAFKGQDWSGSSESLYNSKNSVSQILLTGLILTADLYYNRNRLVSVSIISVYAVLILMLKCRTTIVSMAVFSVYFVLFIVQSWKERTVYILTAVTCVFLILFQPAVYHFIVEEIILNNRSHDLSSLTSGRVAHWIQFSEEFGGCLWLGTGGTYLESLPLAALMSYGLLGGIPVLLFAIEPLKYSLICLLKGDNSRYNKLLISVSLVMFLNSIMEEQAPFGPGTKCYFLWLLFGMLYGFAAAAEIRADYLREK